MIEKLGGKLTYLFLKYMPSAFVFAILLTIFTGLTAFFWTGATPMAILSSWNQGFFDLLEFTMQIVLMIITGYSIALSPLVKNGIDRLAKFIRTPNQVYFLVVFIGMLLSMVSFGWLIITCVLARELAERIKGINYPFLAACVYFSFNSWVMGLSSSIPLLLNTENNFLIESGLLKETIPTAETLLSTFNIVMVSIIVIGAPFVMLLIKPKSAKGQELDDLIEFEDQSESITIQEEAQKLKLPFKSLSDYLDNSVLLQLFIVCSGALFIIYYFTTNGLDLNFNIMIFIFLIIGMFLHKTPSRYAISMKRSSSNISGIIFQYPFYAGIMGIMLYTGLGEKLGALLASVATKESYPFFAYLTGGLVNFAIPSAGGEFAVIGPSLISAIKSLGSGLADSEIIAMITRASLSVAYGESLSNMLQPFFLLIIIPVMGKGVKLQARDVIGYMVIPFFIFFIIQSFLVVYWPV